MRGSLGGGVGLEEAINRGGADDEMFAAYAVAAALKPSNKGEGDDMEVCPFEDRLNLLNG